MKIFQIIFIPFFLNLFSFQFNAYSQKANVQTLQTLCIEEKYQEAYVLVNSKKFKYKVDEVELYYYLYAFTCKGLYQANPEMNSTYRNEGVRFARRLIPSVDPERATQGKNIVDFLTTTIYNDIAINIATKSNQDSIMLGDFTTETIEAFDSFIVPTNLTDKQLYFLGTSFYNDGVYIMTEMVDYNDDIEVVTDRALRTVALMNVAANFFKSLCANYNLHCDTYKMVLKSLGKSE